VGLLHHVSAGRVFVTFVQVFHLSFGFLASPEDAFRGYVVRLSVALKSDDYECGRAH
jgi:hypothetical protein